MSEVKLVDFSDEQIERVMRLSDELRELGVFPRCMKDKLFLSVLLDKGLELVEEEAREIREMQEQGLIWLDGGESYVH